MSKKRKKEEERARFKHTVLFIVHCCPSLSICSRHKRRTSFIPFHPLQPWILRVSRTLLGKSTAQNAFQLLLSNLGEPFRGSGSSSSGVASEEVFTRKHASPSMCIRFSLVDFIAHAGMRNSYRRYMAFFFFFFFLNSFVSICHEYKESKGKNRNEFLK